MKKQRSKGTSMKRTRPSPSPVKAVRDNVLGRRPSKSDPLGEQPGTMAKNPELDSVKVPRKTGAELSARSTERMHQGAAKKS